MTPVKYIAESVHSTRKSSHCYERLSIFVGSCFFISTFMLLVFFFFNFVFLLAFNVHMCVYPTT